MRSEGEWMTEREERKQRKLEEKMKEAKVKSGNKIENLGILLCKFNVKN